MRGTLYWRTEHAGAQESRRVRGTPAQIAEMLRSAVAPCDCCQPAFRSGRIDADRGVDGGVAWSMSPAFSARLGLGYARHGINPHPCGLMPAAELG